MNELDDSLTHLNDLDVTWRFDLDAFVQECTPQEPDPGEAGPARPATKLPRRSVRLKDAVLTLPRSRQGGPKATPPKGTGGFPRGPVGHAHTQAPQLGTAPSDSTGPDPGSEPTPGR